MAAHSKKTSLLTRRSLFFAAGAAGFAGASATDCRARRSRIRRTGPSRATTITSYDLQGTTGTAVDGAVGLDFIRPLPQSRSTSPGGASVLFDPWRDDPSGAWGLWFKNTFPEITVDNHHVDACAFRLHDAISAPVSTMVLDRMVGNFEFADLKITGFADKHACVAPGWYKWTSTRLRS